MRNGWKSLAVAAGITVCGCSARMVLTPGQAQVGEPTRQGIVRYKSTGFFAAKRRADVQRQMAQACPHGYRIESERPHEVRDDAVMETSSWISTLNTQTFVSRVSAIDGPAGVMPNQVDAVLSRALHARSCLLLARYAVER